MNFLKKYWYLIFVTIITAGIGVVAYLTSTRLETSKPVAPTVPQATPKATDVNCKVVFSIGVTPTQTPPHTPTQTPQHTPTSTPTGTPPNTPTPTPTGTPGPSPTATPTSPPNNVRPVCVDLTVSPASGVVPYTVTLTCTGRDDDGDITAAEFTMPDGTTKLVEQNVGSPGSLTTTYTITTGGGYSFSCQVRDNNNVWVSSADCRVSVGPTATPGPSPTPVTPRVPVSGVPSVLGVGIAAGGLLLLLVGLVL